MQGNFGRCYRFIFYYVASEPFYKVSGDRRLRIVRESGSLLPQFENNIFRIIDGVKIPNWKVQSTILEKR
jgi:hypothetical protein